MKKKPVRKSRQQASAKGVSERKQTEASIRPEESIRAEESIRFQARLLDSLEQAVIATDLNGTVVYWNRFAESLYGWSAGEAAGRDILEVTPADISKEQGAEILSRLRTGESWSGEFLVRRRDGVVFPAMITDSPVYDNDGTLIGIVGISRDVTERKLIEGALRESEDRYRDLVEHSLDLICTHDLDGLILSVNRAAVNLIGFDPKDFIGKRTIRDILAPEFRNEFDDYMDRIRRDGVASGVMAVQTARGEKRIWEYYNTLRTDGVAAPIVRGMAHDITERWRTEQALRASQGRLAGIVDSAMDAIITIDEAQRIVLFNPAAEKMFRCRSQEAVGQPLDRFIPERYRVAHRDHIRDFSRTGVTNRAMGAHISASGLRRDGEEFPIEASISQIEAAGQKLYTVILRDITDRRRAEAEREQLIAQLQDAIAKIKVLTGLLPICANCKKIRDKEGAWNDLESYLKTHSEAEFTHGICPECAQRLYPEFFDDGSTLD
ncbi:MAG TPA: PAS domain S-box protein [Blastocatellia bacterium]|jgi:PAS domain S-box-containing protein